MAVTLTQPTTTTLVMTWVGTSTGEDALGLIQVACGSNVTIVGPTSSSAGWSATITAGTAAVATWCYQQLSQILNKFC